MIGVAVYLSIFMSLISLLLPFASHDTDSRDKVEIIQVHMKELLEKLQAPPSSHIMSNFDWENGLPVVDAWTSLWWFRRFHTHSVVTTTWLVVAPLQLYSLGGKRLYSRQWHRRVGYVFVIASACIAIGLMEIIGKGKVYGKPFWLAMAINIFKWAYFVVSLYLALWWPRQTQHSMKQRIQQHKVWMLRHVSMGYTVAFQRFLMFVVGPMLHGMLWERYGLMDNSTDTPMPRMLTSLEMQQWYNVTSLAALSIPPILVEWGVIRQRSFGQLGIANGTASSTSIITSKQD